MPLCNRFTIGKIRPRLWFSTAETRSLEPVNGSKSFCVSPCYSILNLIASIGSAGLMVRVCSHKPQSASQEFPSRQPLAFPHGLDTQTLSA